MQLLNSSTSSGKFQQEILSPFAPLVLNPTQLKKQHKLLKIRSIFKKIQRNLRSFAKGIDIVDLNFDLKFLWRLYMCLKLTSLTDLRFKAKIISRVYVPKFKTRTTRDEYLEDIKFYLLG